MYITGNFSLKLQILIYKRVGRELYEYVHILIFFIYISLSKFMTRVQNNLYKNSLKVRANNIPEHAISMK